MDLNIPYLRDEDKSLVMLMKEFCEREVDRQALNDLADTPIPPNATKKDLMARMPWDLISKAHDAELRQLTVPEEYGGGGFGENWLALTALAEAAGYYGGQVARIFTIAWKHIGSLIYAPKAIQYEVFTDFMNDRRTMCAASITEPNHGSDYLLPFNDPSTGKYFAEKDGDEWVLNGEKMFCTAGGVSNYIIVSCRTDKDAPITKAVTTFVVPTKTPGWSIARVNDMMGNEITANVQMRFENVRVPDRLRTSPVNGGFEIMKSRLAGKTIHLMAALGETEKVLEDMIDYCKARIQGGKPIIQHSNVGVLLAEGDALLKAARLMIYQDAWESMGKGELLDPKGWWYVNWFTKKVILRMVEIGFEIYGGMAPQKELPFERWARMHLSIWHGGSTGTLNMIKASKVL
ncbi:MAG: acyl-CoA dehydrogenase [Deltaproteobacteria bacterium]|nr:acyl-CoA dehydrogenase [Deltaproteobacteria bacterium]